LKKQFPEGNFYEADLRETGIPSDTYDGVWSCAAILNTAKKDIPTVLSEFNRVLKKGGALFISVKEGEGERMVPDKAGERFFSFFKEAEIKSFLENAGFKVDHSEILPGTNFPGSEVQTPPGWLCVYAIKL